LSKYLNLFVKVRKYIFTLLNNTHISTPTPGCQLIFNLVGAKGIYGGLTPNRGYL
jgi:hypothetical protein